MLEKLTAARAAVYAGQHAWVRGGVDDPIDFANGFEVARATKIGVANRDPAFPQRLQIYLTSAAAQVIDPDNLPVRNIRDQTVRDCASYKTANSGNQNSHFICFRVLSRECQQDLPVNDRLGMFLRSSR